MTQPLQYTTHLNPPRLEKSSDTLRGSIEQRGIEGELVEALQVEQKQVVQLPHLIREVPNIIVADVEATQGAQLTDFFGNLCVCV